MKTLKEHADIFNALKNANPDYCLNREQKAVKTCKALIAFYLTNNKRPAKVTSDRNEKYLYGWLATYIKKPHRISPIFIKMAMDAGIPNLFDKLDREQLIIDKCNIFIQFVEHNSRLPSKQSKNTHEHKLYVWFKNVKKLIHQNTNIRHNNIITQLLMKSKHNNLFTYIFKKIDYMHKATYICNNVINFIRINKKPPSTTSKNPYERQLGRWITRNRAIYKGTRNRKFHSEILNQITKAGYPNLFNDNWRDDFN